MTFRYLKRVAQIHGSIVSMWKKIQFRFERHKKPALIFLQNGTKLMELLWLLRTFCKVPSPWSKWSPGIAITRLQINCTGLFGERATMISPLFSFPVLGLMCSVKRTSLLLMFGSILGPLHYFQWIIKTNKINITIKY